MPVIGFLRSTTSADSGHLVAAFRQGLREAGFVEGQDGAIEYRWADNQLDRLSALIADLLPRPVAVIIGNTPSALAESELLNAVSLGCIETPVKLKSAFTRLTNRLKEKEPRRAWRGEVGGSRCGGQ